MKCRAVETGAPVGCVHCGNCDQGPDIRDDYSPDFDESNERNDEQCEDCDE